MKKPIKISSYIRAIKKWCDLSQSQRKIGSRYKSMTPKQKELVRYCIWKLHDRGASQSQIMDHFNCSSCLYHNSIRLDRNEDRKERRRKSKEEQIAAQTAETIKRNHTLERCPYGHYGSMRDLYAPLMLRTYAPRNFEQIKQSTQSWQPHYDNYHGCNMDDLLIEAITL